MKKLFIQLGSILLNPNDISAVIVEPIEGSTHRKIEVAGPCVQAAPEIPPASIWSADPNVSTKFVLSEHTYRKLTGAISERYNVLTIHSSGRTDQEGRGDRLTVLRLIYPDRTVFVFPSKLFAVSTVGRMLRVHVEGVEELPEIYCSEELKDLTAFEDFVVLEEKAA